MSEARGYGAVFALVQPRRLLIASIPADFADWLDYAGVVCLFAYVRHEGPMVLGLFAVCLSLPYILVGPAVAVFVDRIPLRRVLFLSNLGRGLVTLAMFLLPPTPVVLGLVFLRGVVDTGFTPARQAAIKATTPEPLLSEVNGLHQSVNQASKIVGPALGGLWVASLPIAPLFLLNAVMSFLAACLILGVAVPPKPTLSDEKPGFLSEMLAGVGEFRRSARLRLVLIFMCAAYFAFFLYDALISVLAAEIGFGPEIFGFSIVASGVGGLLGGLLAGRLTSRAPLSWMISGALAGGVVVTILSSAIMGGVGVSQWVFVGAIGAAGLCSGLMLVPYRIVVQREAPMDRIGRVFAAGESFSTIAVVTAPLIGGAIAEAFGTPMAFFVGGFLLLVLGGFTLVRHSCNRGQT